MASSKKDLLSLLDFSKEEICSIIQSAADLKKRRLTSDPDILHGKSAVLLFEKPSLRTLITFDTAITELGGHAIILPPNSVQIGKRESVKDVARNLERWVHLLVARTYSHQTLVELAHYSSIPVINALSDTDHPCQALAFGLSMYEKLGDFGPCTVVFVGDGNNVCNALMALCVRLSWNFTLACPAGYEPDKKYVEHCQAESKRAGCTVQISNNPFAAVVNATAIYTDVWASMGQEDQQEKRKKDFRAFAVSNALLSHASKNVYVSHCLPAHREEEITSQVLDADCCIAFDEAENRLHVQKAAIVHLFS